jgi:nucleotide-binding universal stress UspA family protein
MGSVSLAVVGRSPIPVVVVRPGQQDPDETPAARQGDVVVGVSGGEVADEVMEFAFSRALRRGARLVAVHGWDVPAVWAEPGTIVAPFDSDALQSAAEQHLAEALGAWREKYPQVPVVARTEVGGAAKTLVGASDEAELVVIGRRMRRHAAGGHLGAAAHTVLHHAHAPVAVVLHA